MSPLQMEKLLDKMAVAIKAHVERALDPLRSRLATVETRGASLAMMMGKGKRGDGSFDLSDLVELTAALERRVADLETRPTMSYCGVWREGAAYQRGDFVTHDGSVWHAWQQTAERPGTSEAWQLAVKRGRDAKDAPR